MKPKATTQTSLPTKAILTTTALAVTTLGAAAAITVSRPGCAPAMPNTGELEGFLADQSDTLEV